LLFTFHWSLENRWEGANYAVAVGHPTHADAVLTQSASS
jgi:hypothetical protein